jgi:antitoxin MazE
MSIVTRSKVIKIGNSRGVRIPHTLLEQAGLVDEVEMMVQDDQLVIRPVHASRQGWKAHFTRMHQQGDDQLVIDETHLAKWDEEEWTW